MARSVKAWRDNATVVAIVLVPLTEFFRPAGFGSLGGLGHSYSFCLCH